MIEINKLVSVFLILSLVAGCAYAFSFDDLLDWVSSLFGDKKEEVVCNPPYMRLGDACCLDSEGNGICDDDERQQTTTPRTTGQTPTTSKPGKTTLKSSSSTVDGSVSTSAKPPTTTLASKLKADTVTLDGTLAVDVDPVLTASGATLIQPTTGGYLEFVDLSSGSHTSVALSGDILSGVDVLALKSGKAVIPVKKGNGLVDIIDIAGKKIIKSIPLSAQLQVDVDAVLTPDETKALMATRQDTSNSYLEVIDLVAAVLSKKINIQGDLKEGVDPVVYSDGSKAVVPTLKGTGVGARASFIDLVSGNIVKALDVDGRLEEDVDLKLTSNNEILLLPTKTPVLGYLSIIEAKTMSLQKKLTLSGTLKESVDLYFLTGERKAFIPVYTGSQGYIDVIDVYARQIDHSIKLSGDLIRGVDGKLTPDGSLIIIPTQKGTTAYLDIVDPLSGTLKASVLLSAVSHESVDVQISEDGKKAYVLSGKPGLAYVDVVDIASAKLVNTHKLTGGLVTDLDAQLTSGTKPYAVSSNAATGYVTIIRNLPAKALVCLTTGMGTGYAEAIDTSTDTSFGIMSLPGNVVAGVDGISASEASTTPHFDEDMTMRQDDQTVFTTTTHPAQTTTTTTWYGTTSTYPPYTTTTLDDYPQTTTTLTDYPQTTTTTLSDAVITPRCGDGYLSWSGTPGGGSEECDPNTGPYNNWQGAQRYDCPSGLSCVNCKCVGCGDGRLQAGEECDKNNKYSTVNGQRLWQGSKHDCSGEYEMCGSDCKCTSSVVCNPPLYEDSQCDGECDPTCETCESMDGFPCYECRPKDCSDLSGDWSSSVRCDGNHEEIEHHPDCSQCARCKEVCPEDDGYYKLLGCAGKCDLRLCIKVGGNGEYQDCYKCNEPKCGDGIITSGEQCEEDADCPDYHACKGCQCVTDCAGYCADQGSNGYAVFAGAANQAACTNEATARMNALRADCRVVCSATAWMQGVSGTCCCVDADWVPCLNCPCVAPCNPDCDTPKPTCQAKL
ncbi:MAG: hypothetical protein KKD39_02935 [Candidatus Altiarchaeota archaeon]|nr:hypothetical protein [Candidatus Altiarchaeota archaeon]